MNSILNPILVHCLGLGYLFNMYRNKPLVKPGGVVIMYHPVPWEFHQIHHPSYIDFFEEVLRETTDPATIESKYEERYATDPWYTHLYRTRHAYHGVHPFYMWYWGAHGRDHAGDVIFVGGEPKSVARLGYRAARTRSATRSRWRRTPSARQPVDHVLPRAADHDRGRACEEAPMSGLRDELKAMAGRVPMGPAAAGAAVGRAASPSRRTTRLPDRLGADGGRARRRGR